MINYIKAELYRSFNRVYFWGYTAFIAILAVLSNVIVLNIRNYYPTGSINSFFYSFIISCIMIPVFFVFGFIDIITLDENKNETLRNVVVFGVKRSKIILSKLVATVILAFIAEIIILVLFLGSAFILFGVNNELLTTIISFCQKSLVATPLWIAAISIGTCLAVIIKNNNVSSLVYVGIFLITDKIIKVLSVFVSENFKYVGNILITKKINEISAGPLTSGTIISSVLMGAIYTLVFTTITILYFEKKEVK
ncbi:ABC transporter permease subunit (plasmid) [Clostridium estertheticum]|uniref:ABC transporter permease subunit n=1 Tax=Clostridium estertheticum TaxID=238834 RepID=UPI001C7CC9D1|nr:ABC transporter permease [Clostridium estertheticum]MBX4262210.1 ABC transporter permease subunit [Clostridium estertheticum]WLC73151.1 ABC transporter permease subunit [Clostridium estertheticum]